MGRAERTASVQKKPRAMRFSRSGGITASYVTEAIYELPQPAIRIDKEAAVRGFGLSLAEGFRIEAECFNRPIWNSATVGGCASSLSETTRIAVAISRFARRVW
jgi:hypothetical protein